MREARKQARWRIDDPPDARVVAALIDGLGVGSFEARLLAARGLTDLDSARAFLDPRLGDLPDPTTLPGCETAARRIARAIADSEPIVVYGDYDVDGVTACSILWHTLRRAGAEVATYIPHRLDEGYGLNAEALRSIGRGELTGGRRPLVVTVDCGITAIEPCGVAKAEGVEVIVTDHHQFAASGELPSEWVVHPRLEDRAGEEGDGCPWGDISGAGVAFVLAWQIAREHCGGVDRLPEPWRELMVDLLALAALGTVADVVELLGANRAIVAAGLRQLEHARLTGVQALLEATNLRGRRVDTYHVGFVLGPRLNAVGRMGHAREALELLTIADAPRAAELAAELERVNDERRTVERRVLAEAEAMIAEQGYATDDRRAFVLDGPGWHPGVVGIVASRLVDRYHRPAIMLNRDNGTAHGSARSVPGVSIHSALTACDDLLDRYGGHAMAAGLALPSDRVEAFRERLVAVVNDALAVEDLQPTHEAEAVAEPGELSIETCRRLNAFAPFGRGNRRPTLVARGAELLNPPRVVGKTGGHLALTVRHGGGPISVIGHGLAETVGDLSQGDRIDVLFEPRLNEWRGVVSAEMRLIDWRPAEPVALTRERGAENGRAAGLRG
ncbi:MAG: single-stranded-DNA-specific exonuclease RecJ [Planctomycetota bacterium]